MRLAQQLCPVDFDQELEEAVQRTIVSRAYYAAFNLAKTHQLDQDPDNGALKSKQAHQIVYQWLIDENLGIAAQRLKNLRNWRNQCDYDSSVPNINQMTKSALENANSVIAIFKDY